MRRLAFVAFAVACLLQRAAEIVRNDRRALDRRPNWTAIAIVVLFLGFTIGSVMEVFLADRPLTPGCAIAGGSLFAAGFALRQWVLRALGPLWAIDIDLKPNHRLVTSGPYRFCRHPNYVAMLLEMVGFCLAGSAFCTLAVFFPLYVLALAARIRIEETALLGRLGDEYRAYMRRTFALFPIPRSGKSQF